jgi:hypothetical protein
VNSTTDRKASSFGLVALAIGAAPRAASNDLYHRLMLAAIAVSFLLLVVSRARARLQL